MFERYTDSHQPRRRSRLALILSVSFAGHLIAALGLVIAGMWQIERLMPPERSLVVEIGPRIVKASEPKPMERIEPVARKVARKRALKELVQPVDNAPEREPDDDVEYGSLEEIATGPVGEDDSGGTGALGTGVGTLFGDGVSFAEVNHITALPKPPERERVIDVPPKVLEGRRISGNPWIMPPESVRASMYRNDIWRIQGMVKMCLDRTGRVKMLKTLRSIGYKAYDRKLLRTMRHWRYRPYQIDGTPIGVCTVITFIYVMTDD